MIILGLTLGMASQSAFGMQDNGKEAKKAMGAQSDAKQASLEAPVDDMFYITLGIEFLTQNKTSKEDMKECIELCDRGIALCQTAIQACIGKSPQAAQKISDRAIDKFPKKLNSYIFTKNTADIAFIAGKATVKSFSPACAQALGKDWKKLTGQEIVQWVCTTFPLKAQQQLINIKHVQKLASAILTILNSAAQA